MHSQSLVKDVIRPWIPLALLRARQQWRNRIRAAQTARLFAAADGRVLGGPFRGLCYTTPLAFGSAAAPKLLGTYESEIHAAIEKLIRRGCDLLVNIGAGEGYYAVGLLMRLPTVHGLAYEAELQALPHIQEMAKKNGVDGRLELHGLCTCEALDPILSKASHPALVIDAEGAEGTLLDPSRCPNLQRAAILVEVHEYLESGVTDRLLKWYSQSHIIERIPSTSSRSIALPRVHDFSRRQLQFLCDELRPSRMEWFWMAPRSS